MAQLVKNLPGIQEMQVQSLGQEEPLEEDIAATPVFSSGEFHAQGSLLGVSKSQTRLKQLSSSSTMCLALFLKLGIK